MDSSDLLSSRRDRIKANNYNNQKETEYPNKMPRLSSQDLIDIKRGVQEVSLKDGTIVLPKCGGPTCNQDVQIDGSLYPPTPQWRVSTFLPASAPYQSTIDNYGNIYTVFRNDKIIKTDQSGNTITFYSSSNLQEGIIYYAGYIYFFDKDGSNVNRIVRINLFATNPIDGMPQYSGFNVDFDFTNYLTHDNIGNIYYSAGNKIYKFNISDFNNSIPIMTSSGYSIVQIAYYDNKIYFCNNSDNTIKVVDNNIVSTFAGTGASGNIYNVPNLQAKFNGPWGIAIDQTNGDIYISDVSNYQIKKISNGYVTLFAGTGSSDYPLIDGLALTEASFAFPAELLLVSSVGLKGTPNIYVADNESIRLIKYS